MGLFNRIFAAPETTPSSIAQLTSTDDLEQALNESTSQPVLFYKHSAACGSSLFSRREIEQVARVHDGPIYQVTVQAARSVSNQLASHFDIRHETPQVILVHHRKAILHRSHSRISADELLEQIKSSIDS